MTNELIFLGYVAALCSTLILALRLGKEYSIAVTAVMSVLVNLFVLKQITLGGYSATASDALAVGITLSLNLIQEYHSKQMALRTIWISFFCAVFYVIVSLLHLAYIPNIHDHHHRAFTELLTFMPRTVIASLATFLLAQHIDTFLYGALKQKFHQRWFIIRNYGTLFLSQLFDTVLFTFLGLYGLTEALRSFTTLREIILVSFGIKLAVILIAVPFVRSVTKLWPVAS